MLPNTSVPSRVQRAEKRDVGAMKTTISASSPIVPVPPVSAAPLELSKEVRQQLRVTRHRAFERHQENAQWTQQLLDGVTAEDDAFVAPCSLPATTEELQQQLKAKKEAADELERQLAQQKEAQEAEQHRLEELLTLLKAAGDAAALKECEAKLEKEKSMLLPNKPRKMEIVRL